MRAWYVWIWVTQGLLARSPAHKSLPSFATFGGKGRRHSSYFHGSWFATQYGALASKILVDAVLCGQVIIVSSITKVFIVIPFRPCIDLRWFDHKNGTLLLDKRARCTYLEFDALLFSTSLRKGKGIVSCFRGHAQTGDVYRQSWCFKFVLFSRTLRLVWYVIDNFLAVSSLMLPIVVNWWPLAALTVACIVAFLEVYLFLVLTSWGSCWGSCFGLL